MTILTIEPLARGPGLRNGSAASCDPDRRPVSDRTASAGSENSDADRVADQVSDAFLRDCGWCLRVEETVLGYQRAGRPLLALVLETRERIAALRPGEIGNLPGGSQDSWLLLEEIDGQSWIRGSSARTDRIHRADLLEALDESISRLIRPS